MILQPSRQKFMKQHRIRVSRIANSGNYVSFGDYGFKAIEGGYITAKQLESVRRVISRCVKNIGSLWIRVFPDHSITKKPIEVRQGKGCGSIDRWVVPISPGKILFEVSGISLVKTYSLCKVISSKLPLKVKVVVNVF